MTEKELQKAQDDYENQEKLLKIYYKKLIKL